MKCGEWEDRKVPWKGPSQEIKSCMCRNTMYYAIVSGNSASVMNRSGNSEEGGTFSSPTEAKAHADEWLANLCQFGSPQKLTKFKYHTKRGEFHGGCACNRSRRGH